MFKENQGKSNRSWQCWFRCLIGAIYVGAIYSLLLCAEPILAQPSVYVVKEGDTLWSISNQYLKNPVLWPMVWKNNKYIIDPQWIYPGQPIILSSGEEEKRVGPDDDKIKRSIPLPKVAPVPKVLPPQPSLTDSLLKPSYIADQDLMDSCAYIMGEEDFSLREKKEAWGSIVDAKEDKISYSFPDILYIDKGRGEVSPGDVFTVFRPSETVSHPVSNEKLGYLIKIAGLVEVQEVLDKIAIVRIIKSFSEIHKNDRIYPYQKLSLPTILEAKTYIQGFLITALDGRLNMAEHNIVFLDQGSSQQVRPGNRFFIYRQDSILTGEEKEDGKPEALSVNDLVGELVVLKTEAHTCTALITKSKDVILEGYSFSSRSGAGEEHSQAGALIK